MAFNSEYLPVELDNISYQVAIDQYGRTTVPALREQRDNSSEPGENSLDTTGAWTRSQTDWSYGAGQTHFDLDDSDRRRFNSSSGIDPWTKGQITLLPVTEKKLTATSSNLLLQRMGIYLYAAHGEKIAFITDPTPASPTWTEFTPRAGKNLTDITSDGANIYMAFGSTAAIAKATLSGTAIDGSWPSSGTQAADIIHVAAGRLIGALAGNIFEIGSNGAKLASSLDYTTPLASTTWVSVTGAPSGIYAAANTDKTGSIYHIGVSATNGNLLTPIVGGQLPQGEEVNQILAYGELLLIATSTGLRIGVIDTNSNAVTIGPVIEEGGSAHSLEIDGRFVWWGGSEGQTYRADLSVFTATLVPSWASDLVSLTTTGNVTCIARFNNKTYFGDVGDGVYGESGIGTKVLTGTLDIGEVSWSTVAPKLLRNVIVRQDRDQYTFGETEYNSSTHSYNDDVLQYQGIPTPALLGTLKFAATNDNNASSSLTLASHVAKNFEFVEEASVSYKFVMELDRDTNETFRAPIVQDWMTRCLAVPNRVDEIILPIVLRRQVLTNRNSGAPTTFSSNATFTSIRNRMESGVVVSYKEGDRTETVTIERISMKPEKLSDDGSWWEGILLVRLLTVPT